MQRKEEELSLFEENEKKKKDFLSHWIFLEVPTIAITNLHKHKVLEYCTTNKYLITKC